MSSWSTEHLDHRAFQLEREIGRLHEEIRLEERRQEQRRFQQRKRQEYQEEYDKFAFLLSRDTKEARAVLENLYERYPDFLRRDRRLDSDVHRLLSTETGQFEERLRCRLGL